MDYKTTESFIRNVMINNCFAVCMMIIIKYLSFVYYFYCMFYENCRY